MTNPLIFTRPITVGDKCDKESLTSEIRANSSLTIALNRVEILESSIEIHFNSDCDSSSAAIVESIVRAHTGTPLSSPLFPLDSYGNVKISTAGVAGQKQTFISANWADPTTWWQSSTRQENVPLISSSSTSFLLSSPCVIVDVSHHKMSDESTNPDIYECAPSIKVGDIEYVENYYRGLSIVSPTYGFTLDYLTGNVEFNNPIDEALLSEVKISFNKVELNQNDTDPYGPRASAWNICAPENSLVLLNKAEVQFSEDVLLTDSIRFVPYYIVGRDPSMDAFLSSIGLGSLPNGYHLPLSTLDPSLEKRFNTMEDFIDDSDGCYQIPASSSPSTSHRDVQVAKRVYVWNYQGTENMKVDSKKGYYLRLWIKDDYPLTGTKATVTIYGSKFTG